MSGWWAGSASRPFPVPIGTPMAGYMARIGPAEGVRDELTVGALVLDQNGNRLAIVAADVASVDTELVEEISAAADLRPDELVVCASHTHSGPAGVVSRLHPADDDRLDQELRARFAATCAAALREAVDRREPVELIVGRSTVAGLAANRNDPDGPYDPGVNVAATRTFGGQLRAILVHAACHPTILGANSRFISADFPGALRRNLAMRPGDGGRAPEVLYANGAAGDVSTRYSRRSQDGTEVERVGAGFAEAALEALRSARQVHGPLRRAHRRVILTPRSLDGTRVIESQDVQSNAVGAAERRKVETRAQGTALLERLTAAGAGSIRTELELVAWALGDIVLLAVPGELFASLGTTISSASEHPTVVLGYANGYVGYLVDDAAFASGTYEALASPFAPGSGERVAAIGRDLAQRVRSNQHGDPGGD